MRLLVTGGAGYIGSVVTAHLLRAGHEVTVLDDLSTGHADAVPDGARLVDGTLADDAAAVLADGPAYDGVLHFAAKALVGESIEHPERYWHTNVGGTLALLDAMRATARAAGWSSPPPRPPTASRPRCRSRRPRRPGRRTRTAPPSSPST